MHKLQEPTSSACQPANEPQLSAHPSEENSEATSSEQPRAGKLIVLGQTPPPYHGQAVAIQVLIDGLRDHVDLSHVSMRFSETVAENGRLKIRKFFHLFSVLMRAFVLLLRNPGATLYYPPAPAKWVPVLRDLVLLSCLRPLAGKTVFHFHAHGLGQFLEQRRWLRKCTWAWSKPDVAIIHGRSCLEDAEKFEPRELAMVPYGVDVPCAQRRRRADDRRIRVLYVGMHSEAKGILNLLDTADLLRDLDIEFRTVGSFAREATQLEFQQRVRRLELDGIIQSLGQRIADELWQEYADADIFFFPTFYESETFGVVTVEAMAHGLPVVASNWHGPKDVVVHGETGFLCEARDVQAYAQAIRKLAEDPDLRREMGCAARRCYLDRYTLNCFASNIRRVMSRLQR